MFTGFTGSHVFPISSQFTSECHWVMVSFSGCLADPHWVCWLKCLGDAATTVTTPSKSYEKMAEDNARVQRSSELFFQRRRWRGLEGIPCFGWTWRNFGIFVKWWHPSNQTFHGWALVLPLRLWPFCLFQLLSQAEDLESSQWGAVWYARAGEVAVCFGEAKAEGLQGFHGGDAAGASGLHLGAGRALRGIGHWRRLQVRGWLFSSYVGSRESSWWQKLCVPAIWTLGFDRYWWYWQLEIPALQLACLSGRAR